MRTFALCLILTCLPALAAAQSDDSGPADEVVAPSDGSGPWLWMKPSLAVAYGPLGLLGDLKVQLRGPMHRSDSIVFQNTYAGVGGRLAVTPAFVDVGPRFSLAPIDIFDVDVQLSYVAVWQSSSGMLQYHQLFGTLDSQRNTRKGEATAGHLLYGSVTPTFKIKVGPVIAFSSADFAFIWAFPNADSTSPYIYDAYRDMVITRRDIVLTSYTGVLAEILDGESTAVKLRAGALLRHRQAFVSGDVSTALGGAVTIKPGRKEGWPTVLVAVLGYLRDADRAFAAPNIQVQASWEFERAVLRPGG